MKDPAGYMMLRAAEAMCIVRDSAGRMMQPTQEGDHAPE